MVIEQDFQKYELADAILGNELGISYQELRAARSKADPELLAIARARFNACYVRRQNLSRADDSALQTVIDSVGVGSPIAGPLTNQ